MPRRDWTRREESLLAEMRGGGWTIARCAAALGRSVDSTECKARCLVLARPLPTVLANLASAWPEAPTPEKARILDALYRWPGLTVAELAARTNLSVRVLRDHLGRLVPLGQVVRLPAVPRTRARRVEYHLADWLLARKRDREEGP